MTGRLLLGGFKGISQRPCRMCASEDGAELYVVSAALHVSFYARPSLLCFSSCLAFGLIIIGYFFNKIFIESPAWVVWISHEFAFNLGKICF